MESTATSTITITQLSEGELIQLQYIEKCLVANSKELEELFPLVLKWKAKKTKGKKGHTIDVEILEIHGYFSFNILMTVCEVATMNDWIAFADFPKNETHTFCIRFERPIIHVV